MLQRLYVHNFRCLENFELNMKGMSSALLIGKNGSGKSTIAAVLEILQQISRGNNRMVMLEKLISYKDFARGRSDVPIRFEIEVLLANQLYKYVLALDLPEKSTELQVIEEQLLVAGEIIYSRQEAKLALHNAPQNRDFLNLDARFVALPLIKHQSQLDPIYIFNNWLLTQMIILSPIPSLMTGESKGNNFWPERDGTNLGEWLSALLSIYPAAYTQIDKYLREVMPDIQDFLNPPSGPNFKSMIVRFAENKANLSVDFKDLSDGEKCFFLCAIVLAANKFYGPLFCFWDEPDNYLSLSEVGHFITSLRRSFNNGGQILVASHNPEAIRKFSNENTFVLDRKSHLEPTLIRLLSDLEVKGDLINSLISGDIEL